MALSAPQAGEARAGRREERKAQNRAKLLDAAREVFSEKGLGEATARDIVRRTDLASGTFYNYFRDKEDAFRALLQQMSERSRAIVRAQRRAPGLTMDERVANAYRAYFEWVVEERELFQVFRRNAGAIALMPDADLFEIGILELIEDLAEWEEAGEVTVPVAATFPLEQVGDAYERFTAGSKLGKVVLLIGAS